MLDKTTIKKEQALHYITNTMSLRPPQSKSLNLFADYLESEIGKKILDRMKSQGSSTLQEIQELTQKYSTKIQELKDFQSFERTFPSYTYALATGVGKTRLMGAFVVYLYLVYDIQNFLIVAPGNTIYKKLVDDFSKSNSSKYVFKGIEEINPFTANIVTKENVEQNPNQLLLDNKIRINIFNVQQFAQKDIEQEKGITKFSEFHGESYFDYLSSLKDLVVLMDESHHYHADASLESLDRLNPLLGLEFTATPYTGKMIGRGRDRQPEFKKNIFYTYNLGNAIRDGYVKDPWVGTEADIDFSQWDLDSIETDARKLQLAAYFHERAKVALIEYALENNKPDVKPVMLVVAKDTKHASELRALIDSEQFRGGTYIGKVIEVHTKTKGEESDETIEKLLSLEDPDNVVEIVIHVNMLKEGWDVNNIYTIAPIRASASDILTEQTIGRGLRLPYGERTGKKNVDRVMIVAHENYAKVIEAAQHSQLIQPSNIESISTGETKVVKTILEVESAYISNILDQIKSNDKIMKEINEQAAVDVKRFITDDVPEDVKQATIQNKVNEIVETIAKQKAEEQSFAVYHKQSLAEEVERIPRQEGQIYFTFSDSAKNELTNISNLVAQNLEYRNIPIPRLMLMPHYTELAIDDFDLDTNVLNSYATEASILEARLQGGEEKDLFGNIKHIDSEPIITRVSSLGQGRKQRPESTVISALTEFPLIDYDSEQRDLLLKLSAQAVAYYRSCIKDENSLKMVIENNFRDIAGQIYKQILDKKNYKSESYIESCIAEPKPYLEKHNISIEQGQDPVTLKSQLDRFSREKIYTCFNRACHPFYKFDSSDEARFAYLLDNDSRVEDWLRPARNQFEGLYWRDEQGDSNNRYEPDFLVEFKDEIVMVEVKPNEEINDYDVQAKKTTAEKYCELVSKNIGKYGIVKPWRYVIVPTEKITITSTIASLLSR